MGSAMNHQARIAHQSARPPKVVDLDGRQIVNDPQTFIVLWDEVDPTYLLQDGPTLYWTDARTVAAKTPRRKKVPA